MKTESSRQLYIDSSALLKLVVTEIESEALESFLTNEKPVLVSSELATVEVLRFSLRSGGATARLSHEALAAVAQFPITPEILREASRIMPALLRSLDAIHVATAMTIGGLSALVTYDQRMAEAARANGLTVIAPGQDESDQR